VKTVINSQENRLRRALMKSIFLFPGNRRVLRTRPPHRLGGARTTAPLIRGVTRPRTLRCDHPS